MTQDDSTVDFLISPSSTDEKPPGIKKLEEDLGAVLTPGLELAFRDRVQVSMSGNTILGEQATRRVPVAGPGSFVVLKALAFRNRGAGKDAYDLFYVIRNYGAGVADVAKGLSPLLDAPEAQDALQILAEDFSTAEDLGPARVAAFIGDEDPALREEVVAFVQELIAEVE